MLWQIAAVLVIIYSLITRWRQRDAIALAKQLPIDIKCFPFIGHAYIMAGNDEAKMKGIEKCSRAVLKKGGLSAIWLGQKLYVVVADPVNAEVVAKSCVAKDDIMKPTKVFLGNGSIFAPVEIWRYRRRVLSHIFTLHKLTHFVPVLARQSSVMVKQLQNKVGAGTFPLWKYYATYSLDSIAETTLGVEMNTQLASEHPYFAAYSKVCQLGANLLSNPWLHSEYIYKMLPQYATFLKQRSIVYELIDKIISSKQKEAETKYEKAYNDKHQNGMITFLESMIDTPDGERGFTAEELREETLVLILGGTDTSAASLAFATVMLSRHADVQDKVYEELQTVFGDSDRPVEADDLFRLKYLEAVLKETLRLYNPVPIIVRKVEKSVTLPSGVTLIPGTGVVISIWGIHRNPQYWGSDAEVFRPERFLEGPLKHPNAFIPFSHGTRNCIGYQYAMMSMKTVLATLLRSYRVLPPAGYDDTMKNVLKVKYAIISKAVDDFLVQLEPRNPALKCSVR